MISRNNLDISINDTVIVAFLKIPLSWFGLGWAAVFPDNLALY